jgi:two-component system response regulator PilR (NtrC family)
VALLPGFNLEAHLDQVAKRYIQEAGGASGGNLKKAAELLGIGYRSLRYLLDKYQIQSFKKPESPDRRDAGA